MKAINLKTEYLREPLGIDITSPRLMWNCQGGTFQSGFIIKCFKDEKMIFNSGKVNSNQMMYRLPFLLHSRDRIVWKITLFDENGLLGEESESFFEMGLLTKNDWEGKWIKGDYKVKKHQRYPIDCFLKEFSLNSIKKARLYITALGLYEAKINDKKVGLDVFTPGHTDYNKRVQYQTYDVTNLLKEGKNKLSIMLADGYYRGSIGAWGLTNQYGKETKLLLQLEIEDNSGNISKIVSDESFSWSNDGMIRFADNKDGEIVDFNYAPSYKGKAKLSYHKVSPSASNNVAPREHETFTPELIITPKGDKVLDFKQNIAGYISFSLKGKKGDKIELLFGEMLDSNGEFTQKNFQCISKKKTTPLQRIICVLKDGVNDYKTRFSIMGFRYCLVKTDVPFSKNDFTAISVYSSLEDTLSLETSSVLINKLVSNIRWSLKNNSLDVPTDCPTRERHGWTGDSQIFFNSAAYLTNYAPFARKHLRDIYDWQKRNGNLPQIAPYGGVDFYMNTMNGSPGWSDCGILIPYRFYRRYNDLDILKEFYGQMQKYSEFLIKRIGKKTLLSKPLHLKRKYRKYAVNYGQSYGEWAEPADIFPMKWTDMILPHPEVSTAYTAYMMNIMSEIALLLGDTKSASRYQFYFEKVKEAYQEMRKLPAFTLDTNRQSVLVRPLYLNLLNEKQTIYARERLIKALENYHFRVGTGFLSTPFILDVLTSIDIEYAYKLLENEEMPGWLFMVKDGGTTIYESWEGTKSQKGVASLDHYSKGACLEWMVRVMAGIDILPNNKIVIAPKVGGHISFIKCCYQSVYGMIESSWKKTNDKVKYHLEIPSNVICSFSVADQSYELESGTYDYFI